MEFENNQLPLEGQRSGREDDRRDPGPEPNPAAGLGHGYTDKLDRAGQERRPPGALAKLGRPPVA